MTSKPAVAFLGTGRMGLPMTMNLPRAGGRDAVTSAGHGMQ
jgi:3-hydroxyisobutyrate dehydrogenase-like beta-hydroxyacid dehydrogenase